MKLLRVSFLAAVALSGGLLLQSCTLQNQQQQMLNGQQYFEQQNYTQAFKELKPLAEKGNADAQYAVGYMYYYGKGTQKNVGLALQWMNKAAQQGQPLAKQALRAIGQQAGPGAKAQFTTASGKSNAAAAQNANPAANAASNTKMPNFPQS